MIEHHFIVGWAPFLHPFTHPSTCTWVAVLSDTAVNKHGCVIIFWLTASVSYLDICPEVELLDLVVILFKFLPSTHSFLVILLMYIMSLVVPHPLISLPASIPAKPPPIFVSFYCCFFLIIFLWSFILIKSCLHKYGLGVIYCSDEGSTLLKKNPLLYPLLIANEGWGPRITCPVCAGFWVGPVLCRLSQLL